MLTEFTVDRSRWLRGEGTNASRLQREADGKRCCLGFMCFAAGVPEKSIINVGLPSRLSYSELLLLPDTLRSSGSNVQQIVTNNDQQNMSGPAREAKLTELFQAAGIKVTFVDGPIQEST